MKGIGVWALVLTVAVATPALAQKGKEGKAEKSGRQRAQTVETRGQKVQTRAQKVDTRGQKVDKRGQKVVTRGRNDNRDYGVRVMQAKSGAPSYCRSGAGHPVFGRSWCVQKGFGLGSGNWNRATWGDVVLQPRRASIGDVLGSVVLGRLTNYAAQRLGLASPLTGSWLTNTTDNRVYMVRSGTVPVAEMVDVNGDRRADYVLLYNR